MVQRGVIQALDDKIPQAEDSFRRAAQAKPDWMLPRLALGITQLQTARLPEAIQSFEAAARFRDADYRVHYLLALAQVRAGGQNQPDQREHIIARLQTSLSLNPDQADSRILLGQTYLAAGQIDLAVSELERARKLQPQSPTAAYQLGTAYRKKGRLVEARDLMKQFEQLKARENEEEDLARKQLVQILKVVPNP